MNTLYKLTIMNIKMFLRNRQAVFFTFFMPVVIMTIIGLLAFDSVPKVEMGVAVTAPPTAGTQRFLDQLKEIPAFDVNIGTEPEEREAIADGERSVVLIVPADLFPEGDFGEEPRAIRVLTNPNDQQQAATAVTIVNQILDKSALAIAGAPQLFELNQENVDSRDFKYIDFLVPGIVALSIMQMATFSVAFVFVEYKEKGVLKRLIATPMRPMDFVAANVITRLLVAVIQSAFLIAVGVIFFGAAMIGSYWLLLPAVMLGSIMFIGLGFTISGFAKTVETVPAIANLVVFPMMFLGGTFFPLDTMPGWLQGIAQFLPLTYLSESVREVMLSGAGFNEIGTDLLWMLAWSVALVLAANYTFGFEEKRQ